jgi:hypothetical protein
VVALLRSLIELCLLRRGPQDLPYSPPAVAVFAAILVAMQVGFASNEGMGTLALLARAVVTLVLLFGVTSALLRLRGLDNRRAQTLLALAGSGVIFSLAMMPVAHALRPYLDDKSPPPQMLALALAAVILFVWKLRVDASIWRQAMGIPVLSSYGLALSLMFGEAILLGLLVPVPAAP